MALLMCILTFWFCWYSFELFLCRSDIHADGQTCFYLQKFTVTFQPSGSLNPFLCLCVPLDILLPYLLLVVLYPGKQATNQKI